MLTLDRKTGLYQLRCDCCLSVTIEIPSVPYWDAAILIQGQGWKTMHHSQGHFTNICPDCLGKIK